MLDRHLEGKYKFFQENKLSFSSFHTYRTTDGVREVIKLDYEIDSGISKEDAMQSTHQYDPIKNLNMQEKVILKKLFEENR